MPLSELGVNLMKKIVLAMAVFTFAVWLSTSSLLLSSISTNSALNGNALALNLEEEKKSFRPVEFSAEVNLDEYRNQSSKADTAIVEKLDKAKKEMVKICGSLKTSAVR